MGDGQMSIFDTPEIRERDAKTKHALMNPEKGQRFTEMYAYWVYVLDFDGDYVTYMDANPPCEFPKDGKVHKKTFAQYISHFSYSSIPGSWITFVDDGNDVTGWGDK